MIKKPDMAKQVNKKVWVTIIDLLRFATPILLFVITLMVTDYKDKQSRITSTLTKQTEKLDDINIKLARLLERETFGTTRIDKLDVQVTDVTKIANKNTADIQYLIAKTK